MVKAAKINITNANVRTLRLVITITTPYKIVNKTYWYGRQNR